jgi:hypothetical protein
MIGLSLFYLCQRPQYFSYFFISKCDTIHNDLDHCPFAMGSNSKSTTRRLGAPSAAAAAAATAAAPEVEVTDACSELTACGDCTANAACGWCIGNLYDTATDTARSGAKCFTMGPTYSCQGTTLTDSCDVYKCPWCVVLSCCFS